MRRLSGVVLAGVLMLLPAAFSLGHGRVHAQAQALTFDGDTAIITVAIKPDKGADFESIMGRVRDALMKSEKPERKQQAAGWRVVKSPTAMKDGNIIYMHVISPVVKGADYSILPILYEANTDPMEQRKLFETYRDSFAANLGGGAFTTVVDLSKAP
ncbi:MAG: hypothetical protein Q7J25_09285 [Vicinamibacterales bacterium]|nr:hypothetical protein [Vicinamibacterales bacterium]